MRFEAVVRTPAAILIGGSAGSLAVLQPILRALPAQFPIPLVLVIHQPRRTTSLLSQTLQSNCRLRVGDAHDKQPLEKGAVYVAPPDYHLLLDPGPVLSLSVDQPVNYSRPSVDVLFESAADVLGPRCAALVVSGANADGALGLRAIQAAGGLTGVLSPADSEHAAMPEAALAACPAALVLGARELPSWILGMAAAARGRGAA